LSGGPLLDEFESRFASYVGVDHAIAINSGTAALYTLLKHYRLDGGEVIVPTMTCFACASAVILAGGTPRLVNVDPETMCLDFEDTVGSLTAKTRGMIAVDFAGQVVPWIDDLRALCRERGLFLLEDAAHATGASVGSRRAGSLGDAACFSFHPTKIITTGEGGMITTNDPAVAAHCRRFRDPSTGEDGPSDSLALNLKLDEMSCAMGIEQLSDLDSFVQRRNETVAQYGALLAGVPGVELLPLTEGRVSSWWKAYARLDDRFDRDAVMNRMLIEHRIDVRPAYRPLLHNHPVLGQYVSDRSRFSPSDQAMGKLICLPVFVGLTSDDIARVVRSLQECLRA
jgi:dTDP-4-amino-4,6-dideoxygalactose transaminase